MSDRMTTTELAHTLGISTATLQSMRRYAGFPLGAMQREGRALYWDVEKVFAHLRSWKVDPRRAPSWLHVVGHPEAAKYTTPTRQVAS